MDVFYMRVFEILEAWGHPNVIGENRKTFEITTEKTLTKRGDCIIAVNASKGPADLSENFKKLARRNDTKITVIVRAGDMEETAVGWGSPKLTYAHEGAFVARKSRFTCSRTLMIRSDKASTDFSRRLIRNLQNPGLQTTITLIAET
jgi:hypothetical protein